MFAGISDSRLGILTTKIPLLREYRQIIPLGGGLTNMNYCVETASGKYVLRISDEATGLLGIDRDHERRNTESAFQAGVGAAVMDALPDEHVLVLRWIEAETLHAAGLQTDPLLLKRVALALKKLHNGPAFEGVFYFPSIRKKYLQIVRERGYHMPDRYIELEPLVLDLEKQLAIYPEDPVPCNNDLLAENFLDDGEKIWIIDYEYAGQNEPSFDIGNLASECSLADDQLELLCDTYWHEHLPNKIARAAAWSIIARYGWVLWASIQEAVSPISFDFRNWGRKKWDSVVPDLLGTGYKQISETLNHFQP